MHKALTYVNLPPDNLKRPGDKITKQEWEDAGQTEDQIAELEKHGSVSEDMDAEIHESHRRRDVTEISEGDVADLKEVLGADGGGGSDGSS